MLRVRPALVPFAVLGLVCVAGARQPAATSAPAALEVEAWLHAGRYEDALAAIAWLLRSGAPAPRSDRSALSIEELPLLAAIVTDSPAPANMVTPQHLAGRDLESYWYVQGVLAGRAAWPGGKPESLNRARDAADRLATLAPSSARARSVELRRVSVLAAIAAAQEERDEFTLLAFHATQLDAQLRGMHVPDERLLPWDELAGDLWLQIDRYEDAVECYRRATARQPERTRAWVGRARAARDAGLVAEAREAARRVLANWAPSGGSDAIRSEMRSILGPRRQP